MVLIYTYQHVFFLALSLSRQIFAFYFLSILGDFPVDSSRSHWVEMNVNGRNDFLVTRSLCRIGGCNKVQGRMTRRQTYEEQGEVRVESYRHLDRTTFLVGK